MHKTINELLATCRQETILIAVTKTISAEIINKALSFGITDIGENKVQEAKKKFPLLEFDCKKHLIGHLQSNKVKDAVKLFDYIHSVDSLNIAKLIDQECKKQNKKLYGFIELNLGDEESKTGFKKTEFEKSIVELLKLENINFLGLMTIPPYSEIAENSREYFRELKKLARKYNFEDLSMGMSQDYKIAIEEGATFIRIGTLIFGERK